MIIIIIIIIIISSSSNRRALREETGLLGFLRLGENGVAACLKSCQTTLTPNTEYIYIYIYNII